MRLKLFNFFGRKEEQIKEGTWREFSKQAILISMGSYLNGQKHGLWQEFYSSGELMLEETYQKGISNGRYATYHPNGTLQSEGNFLLGRREVYFRLYTEEGQPVKSQHYIEDKLTEETSEI